MRGPPRRFFWALMLVSGFPALVDGCDFAESVCGAEAPGDVVIGILLPCHRKVKDHVRIRPENYHCSE